MMEDDWNHYKERHYDRLHHAPTVIHGEFQDHPMPMPVHHTAPHVNPYPRERLPDTPVRMHTGRDIRDHEHVLAESHLIQREDWHEKKDVHKGESLTESYQWKNDIYSLGDFPYDDHFFHTYHMRIDYNQVKLAPLPANVQPKQETKKMEGEDESDGCWVRTFLRGLGRSPEICRPGEELISNKCFPACKDDYTGWGTTCLRDCEESKY